jgi:signal transduction histidine kinase
VSAQNVELEARWAEWLRHRNRRGTTTALWIALLLYPLFGVLDYLIAPEEWLGLLYSTRIAVTVVTVILFQVVRTRWFELHPNAISASYMVLLSLGISLMTVFMGGLASPYYAGLTLTIVATSLLFVWPTQVVVPTHATIVLSFLAPNLLLNPDVDWLTAVSNQFFLVSTALIAGTGQILGYGSQREQISNQLILEQTSHRLENAHEQLKELDRFKSEFFANITHELKTPLTMVLSPLELLLDGQQGSVSPAQRSTFQSMQRSGMKLFRLIGDLLDLSKLEESRLRLRIEEHDWVDYLRGLVAQIEPLAQRKSIELHFESNVEHAHVWCDSERVERVFINLLSNATKFTDAGGTVFVRLFDEGESVRVDVTDTGVGFPTEMAEQVFMRFFQADMAGTRRFGGAGIGLALAKELVELHDGGIWARSSEGDGATFSVRFLKARGHFRPEVLDRRGRRVERLDGQRVADRSLADWQMESPERFRLLDIDEATEQRLLERDADEDRRNYSVLVVDDTPDVTRMIRLALHHEFRVLAAPDGQRGYDLAVEHQPTVIVTDWMMPEMDGLTMTRKLRDDPRTKEIPIVMLTARSDIDDRVQGLDVGVNAFLEKPFSGKELASTVRGLLRSREATADVMLTQKMDSLETIAGGLAHEIRNPLNYIKNALAAVATDSEALVEATRRGAEGVDASDVDKRRARMNKMFDVAQAGVKRIAATVDLMVRYSREGYSRDLHTYDVFAATRDVVDVVVPAVGSVAEISIELEGVGLVDCVAEEFNQVVTNLVQNALEAAPRDATGLLRVKGWVADNTVHLSVRDNGPGISPEDQVRIFNPFFTTKEVGRGMGLGLTITHRVVKSLGGTLTVDSKLGAGTTFLLRVPRSARAEAVT